MLVLLNNLNPAQNALLFDSYFLLKNNLYFNIHFNKLLIFKMLKSAIITQGKCVKDGL